MNYLLKPFPHQLEAIHRAKDMPYFALFFEPRTGKTGTTINILRAKMNGKQCYLRTLIFCPPTVIPTWEKEFQLHSKIPKHMIIPLNGSGTKRLKTFLEYSQTIDPITSVAVPVPRFFITNYESLLMKPLYEAFLQWGPQALVKDESHRLKSHSAKRSKLAEKLANPKNGVKPLTYLLSGSPILNSPMDLFQQYLIMDGGTTLGKNFYIFRARFFRDKNAGMPKGRYFPDWVLKTGAIEEIERVIQETSMTVKRKNVHVPKFIQIPCGMTAEQMRNYKELKNDFVTYVGEKAATASLAIVKALRLMQIASGHLPLESSGEDAPTKLVYSDTPKEQALRDLLEELTPHSKVLVWCVWKENYATVRRVCEELKLGLVEVHGEISRKAQDEAVVRFREDSETRVFLGHPGSGGIGIDLTCRPGTTDRCVYSIFYSRTFSLEHWIQATARNEGPRQLDPVTHHILACSGTLDEVVSEKLLAKEQLGIDILKESICNGS